MRNTEYVQHLIQNNSTEELNNILIEYDALVYSSIHNLVQSIFIPNVYIKNSQINCYCDIIVEYCIIIMRIQYAIRIKENE